ncbi:3-hydroxyacyl-ACP dehydratase FabZ [sulfur-oxidizing endosymbiont of Gigantopelta aegis]|uniref:3-hydroxyacyl-ACP dehydratase FabZ n=1 Tax=sulfur-oxidizing endosymbiont of Gigantopelta aegis TaxID=2794934 RepID=UPI001FECBB54|nr:3-hydroxyacyl-ACP dehydratase FabZ [sulfur-oxidizing endosymbiont of Gigantopelta aegis]
MEKQLNTMDIQDIMDHLPHRYPFLLVDKVLDFESGKSLTALKNVTYNEPQFTGHFPQKPILPGVLVIEALAQATGILAYKSTGTKPNGDSLYYLVGIDKARFKRPVNPGEQLILKVDVIKNMRGVWKFAAVATVDDQLVASAELMCAERDA